MDLTSVLIKLIEHSGAILTALALVLGSLGTILTAFWQFRANSKLDRTNVKLDQNTELTKTVGKEVTENAKEAKSAAVKSVAKVAELTTAIDDLTGSKMPPSKAWSDPEIPMRNKD